MVMGVEGAGLTNALVMPRDDSDRARSDAGDLGRASAGRHAAVINFHPAHPEAHFSTLVSECGQSYRLIV